LTGKKGSHGRVEATQATVDAIGAIEVRDFASRATKKERERKKGETKKEKTITPI
jgi:hypothetical protein